MLSVSQMMRADRFESDITVFYTIYALHRRCRIIISCVTYNSQQMSLTRSSSTSSLIAKSMIENTKAVTSRVTFVAQSRTCGRRNLLA